jgi:opacity protein-like surface antigen
LRIFNHKKFCSIFVALLIWATPPVHSAYLGGSVAYRYVLPKVFWTNPLSKWLEDNVSKVSSAISSFYSVVDREIFRKEEYFNNLFLVQNSEKILFDKWHNGCGASIWIGRGKTLPDNFYVGCEAEIKYSRIKMQDTSKATPLLRFADITFFYRHGFSGSSSFSTDVLCNKNIAVEAAMRLGFFPSKNTLTYFKLGIGVNQYVFDKFRISVNNDISIERFDDQGKAQSIIFDDFPKLVEYSTLADRTYSFSMNMGIGIEHTMRQNWFMRLEYEFDFSFANKLKLFSDQKLDFSNLPLEYALRIQGIDNCISLGFGKRF